MGSAANTAKNKETGALLAGSFCKERNAWIVTHLIYPKQMGTATYYTEISGNNYWTYFIEKKLTQLGSIHTHPNFSSFMSCVDLHMHAGIQRYENSAVAFVYSPLHETAPIFSINDLGLGILLSCPSEEQDEAHPHSQPDDSLYYKATHTKSDPNLALSVLDCRDCLQPVGSQQEDDDADDGANGDDDDDVVQPDQQQPPSFDDLPDIDPPPVCVTRQHSFRVGDFQNINFPTAPRSRGRPLKTRTRFNNKRPKSTAFMDDSDSGKTQ